MSYDIPQNQSEFFNAGENQYQIIDYSPEMEMNNCESMNFFIDEVGLNDFIVEGDTTQYLFEKDGIRLWVESGGLGDFFSHGFDVTIDNEVRT